MTIPFRAATARPSAIRHTDAWNAEPPAKTRAEHDRRARQIADWAERQTHPLTADDLCRAFGADL